MSEGKESTFRLEVQQFSNSYLLRAIEGRREVGRLSAVIHSELEVLLGDLRVDDEVEAQMSSVPLFGWLRSKRRPVSYRGKGIGSILLDHFLGWCRDVNVVDVYGSVTASDLQKTPWLLDWYRRHGFEVLPPDSRCIGGALHLVVWKNGFTHPSGGGAS
jgi:hypothetical protein